MVFSSIPAYLDPTNWHQQAAAPLNHEQQSGGGLFSSGHQLLPLPPPPPPPPPPQPHGGGGAGSIRPGSMVDRARMANIPMPEAALKCPRCESTNTKFCYFNNYSLSQPRHFCKTCRRYWTRGGAMRSVPVGGGCRRNKRTKPKSPAAASTCSSGSANSITSTGTAADHIFQGGPLRFMSPLHNYSEIGCLSTNYNNNIPGLVGNDFNFHSLGLGSSSSSSSSSLLGSLGEQQQWRVQQHPQFPFLDPSPLYPFDHHHQSFMGHQQLKASPLGVKMEDSHHHQLRQLVMGNNNNNDQFWSGGAAANAWTDLSGFSSSSTSHP